MTIYNLASDSLDSCFDEFEYLMMSYDLNEPSQVFEELRETAQDASKLREYLFYSGNEDKFKINVTAYNQVMGMMIFSLDIDNGEILVELKSGEAYSSLAMKKTTGGLLAFDLGNAEDNPFEIDSRLLSENAVLFLLHRLMTYINYSLKA